MFDVSHMLGIDLHGSEAQAFLRRLLANDVAKLTVPGKALYSCMLQEDGGVIDDLIVYFFTPTNYRIVVNAGTAEKDLAWMRLQAANFAVSLTPRRDLAMIAVQGPQARERFWAAFPDSRAASEPLGVFQAAAWLELADRPHRLHRRGWLRNRRAGERKPPTSGKSSSPPASSPAGLGARDTLRLEAGMNLYGQDMDETQNPLESGLDLDGRHEGRQPRLHRKVGAGGTAVQAAHICRPGAARQGRAARPPESRHGPWRWRNHQRQFLADLEPIDRLRPRARRRRTWRYESK